MRKIGNYIALSLLFITMSFLTSCFKDPDSTFDQLDDKEVAEYYKKMKGDYNGKCYYSYIGKNNEGMPKVIQDSIVNVQWTLNDNGVATISKLPVSLFSKALKMGSQFDFLSDEISKCEDIAIEARILPLRTPDGSSYPFEVLPKDNVVFNVKYEGRNYKIVLQFSQVVNISGLYFNMEGICVINKNEMFMNLPIGQTFVNDVQTGVSPSMFRYVGVRKVQDKK